MWLPTQTTTAAKKNQAYDNVRQKKQTKNTENRNFSVNCEVATNDTSLEMMC